MATYRGGDVPDYEPRDVSGLRLPGMENVEEELNLPPEAGTERIRRPGEKGYMKERHMAGTPTPRIRGNLPPPEDHGPEDGREVPSRPMEWYERGNPKSNTGIDSYASHPWRAPAPPEGVNTGRGLTREDLMRLHRENPEFYDPPAYQQGGAVVPYAEIRSRVPSQTFDPEGSEYDHATQKLEGMEHDQKMVEGDDQPHDPSRVPRTGMLLKGRNHPTFDKGVEVDRQMGYGLEMRDGRYYTQPFAKHEEGGMVEKPCKHGSSTVVQCSNKFR